MPCANGFKVTRVHGKPSVAIVAFGCAESGNNLGLRDVIKQNGLGKHDYMHVCTVRDDRHAIH
jgi:hypothetical protein